MSGKGFNSNDEIKVFIEKNYDIKVSSIEKMKIGTADLYNLNNCEYVFKVFQDKYTPKEIVFELEVFNVLRKSGVNVPTYVKTITGEYYKEHKGLVTTIQEYIKGKSIDMNSGNKSMLLDLASCYGKIIKVLNNSNLLFPETNISDWYSDDTINNAIEKLFNVIELAISQNENEIADELKSKVSLLKDVRTKHNLDELSKLTVLKSHGDFNHLQCLYNNENKIIAVLDFVSSSTMPVSWEIIRSYSYLDEDAKEGRINIENLKNYVEEVMKYQTLSKDDIKYMCLIYYVQLLTSSFGYKQYLADKSNTDLLKFARFRTKLCVDLSENMDKYTIELLKLYN